MHSDHKNRFIVDAIHGDVAIMGCEWKVIDTPTFQRLRRVKQLGMGHFTYPNVTHTRFAHSIGVLAVTARVIDVAGDSIQLSDEVKSELRLAALLHDIGHYPYSHILEGADSVLLTEEQFDSSHEKRLEPLVPYPNHEELGKILVTSREDLCEAVGGNEKAERVANLFTRSVESDSQLSKLLHSSLDMDRVDYLLRDARAAGVPYGEIDINYILNNMLVGPDGTLGFHRKASAALQHFLTCAHLHALDGLLSQDNGCF
jgi:uncharacterized protein